MNIEDCLEGPPVEGCRSLVGAKGIPVRVVLWLPEDFFKLACFSAYSALGTKFNN